MSDQDRVTEIVDQVRARLDRGEAVDAEAVVRAHPDLAARLRERLLVLERLDLAFRGKDPVPAGPSLVGRDLGPYRIITRLGAGGMGTVYLASLQRRVGERAQGERVALKVVHPHLLEREGSFKRFLREAEIGRRIHHENVVRTVDADVLSCDGSRLFFLVMEYVEGQTLRSLLAELGRLPEELCRHVGREVAKALAAIHAAGAVHRDLKPDNVLISSENVVKVMDLGVALQREDVMRVSEAGSFVGSVRYAAPEQFRAGIAAIDGRADLYSLGLLLYELATGVHPFPGDDFHVVLQRQLAEIPRPAGELNPQISPFLEEVLRRLLEKDRELRWPSATAFSHDLDEGDRSPWWLGTARTIQGRTHRPLRRPRVPRETLLYGRDGELARLRTAFEEAKRGEGRVLVLEGEAGIGKTRLIDEFVATLQRQGEDVNFLFGGNEPGGAATAAGAFAHAYREHFGAAGLDEVLRACLVETPALVPGFAALLRGDALPEGVSPLTRDSFQTAFVHVTRALAKERLTIVLIEDLHFAPDEGRALFAALALAITGSRVLLVGTTRPDLPGSWMSNLERQPHASRLQVPRLGPKDLSRLLVDAFRSERLAEELAFRIGAKSDGNPYFVFEIIRGMREGQLLTQRPDGTWATTQVIREIQIPSTVKDLITARMSDLRDDERELLDVASCVGFEFDAGLAADALGIGVVPALKRLARIESRHRLVHAAGEHFVFDHHQVQETLYVALPPPLARAYHAAVAEAIERRTGASSGEPSDLAGAVSLDLAEHFLAAGLGARSLRYLDEALSFLEGRFLNDAAIQLLDRVLAVPGLVERGIRCELLLRKADRLNLTGRRGDEASAIREAITITDSLGDARLGGRARVALGKWFWITSQHAESQRTLEQALALARSVGDRQGEALCALALGTTFSSLGRYADARSWFEASLDVSQRIADRRVAVRAVANLGTVLYRLGRFAEARSQYEKQLSLAREIEDREAESRAVGNLGNVLHALGRSSDARSHYERRIEIATELGDRRGEVYGEANLGLALVSLGRYAEARTHYDRCLALAREIEDRESEAFVRAKLGRWWRALGDPERASEELIASLTLARRIGVRHVEGEALLALALVAQEDGDPVAAATSVEEALAVYREIGNGHGVAEALVTLGKIRRSEGKLDAARAALEQAFPTGERSEVAGSIVPLSLLAGLPGGDPQAAESALVTEWEDHEGRMEAHFLLWEATAAPVHLAEARRALSYMVENAPPESRRSMRTSVRLHRDILSARGSDISPAAPD